MYYRLVIFAYRNSIGYLADWNRIHGKYDIAPWNGYFPKWEILLKDMALSAKNVKDENSSK